MSRTVADAPDADVLIDFTLPGASVALIRDAAKRGMAVVTGTTGLSDEQEDEIREAGAHVPIVRSGNFSLGVNMLLALVEEAAAKLDITPGNLSVRASRARDRIRRELEQLGWLSPQGAAR